MSRQEVINNGIKPESHVVHDENLGQITDSPHMADDDIATLTTREGTKFRAPPVDMDVARQLRPSKLRGKALGAMVSLAHR